MPVQNMVDSGGSDVPKDTEVAVIGMAGIFPGSPDVDKFWQVIHSGKSMHKPFHSPHIPLQTAWERCRPPEKYQYWGNFLDGVDKFDHRFFKLSAREATYMDPQQRLMLQVAYQTLEAAGHFDPEMHDSSKEIGCYLGIGSVDYHENVGSHEPSAFSATGTLRAFLSGRVSHFFGWSGPSITYDTACSSSAVAIHSACRALQAGDCYMALAGGVNVITSPVMSQNLAAAGFLSPTGPCKPFDAAADGYCRGEGVGAVLLKSLSNAINDGDRIIGIIRGSGVSQGGNTTPITAPHSLSQTRLQRKVLAQARLVADDIGYVEAHGTGTTVGDTIECESLCRLFASDSRQSTTYVGSVKGNIGHLEAASGIASLIKVLLMFEHQLLPGQANFRALNPSITQLRESNLSISTENLPWKGKNRTALISNYGAAGSNAVLVVGEGPSLPVEDHIPVALESKAYPQPLLICAKSPESLIRYSSLLLHHVREKKSERFKPSLDTIAFALAHRMNSAMPNRYIIIARSISHLEERLHELASGSVLNSELQLPTDRPVILCFSGQMRRSIGLNRLVYDQSRLLRFHVDQCSSILERLGFPSIRDHILSPQETNDPVILQSVLFTIQYACAKAWMACGITPCAVIGSSLGEITALVISGALDLEDGLQLIAGRSSLIRDHWLHEKGLMLSVETSRKIVDELIKASSSGSISNKVEIACFNGPTNFVLSGPNELIRRIESLVEEDEMLKSSVRLTTLGTTHAFHSKLAAPVVEMLDSLAANLTFKKPTIPLESCLNPTNSIDWSPASPSSHLTQPVHFAAAVERLSGRYPEAAWLEGGTASSIIPMVRRANAVTQHKLLFPVNVSDDNAWRNLVEVTVNLWRVGCSTRFWPHHRSETSQHPPMSLPPYSFDQPSHWVRYGSDASTKKSQILVVEHLSRSRGDFAVQIEDTLLERYITGHKVMGVGLCPASVYIHIAHEALRQIKESFGIAGESPMAVQSRFLSPVTITKNARYTFSICCSNPDTHLWDWELKQRALSNESSKLCAAGTLCQEACVDSRNGSSPESLAVPRYEDLRDRFSAKDSFEELLFGRAIYRLFSSVVKYAEHFKAVYQVAKHGSDTFGRISFEDKHSDYKSTTSHDPIVIDNMLQVAGLQINFLEDVSEDIVYVCTGIDVLREMIPTPARGASAQKLDVRSSISHSTDNERISNIHAFDPESSSLRISIFGARFKGIPKLKLSKMLQSSSSEELKVPETVSVHDASNLPTIDIQANGRTIQPSNKEVVNGSISDLETLQKAAIDLIAKLVGVSATSFSATSTLEALSIDSLMYTELLAEIKNQFGVRLTSDALQRVRTVADLCHKISEARGGGILPIPSVEPETDIIAAGDSDESTSVGGDYDRNDNESRATTDMNATTQKLLAILSELLGVSTNELSAQTQLLDVGIDSLFIFDVCMELEKAFNIKLAPSVDIGAMNIAALSAMIVSLMSPPSRPSDERPTQNDPEDRKLKGRMLDTARSQACQHELSTNQLDLQNSILAPNWILDDVKHQFDHFSVIKNFSGYHQDVRPHQDALTISYICEAFKTLGCDLKTAAEGTTLPHLRYENRHQRLISRLWDTLIEASIVSKKSDNFFVRGSGGISSFQTSIMHDELMHNFPLFATDHQLLRVTAPRLSDCLQGRENAISLLFGDSRARTTLEKFYSESPVFTIGTALVLEVMKGIIPKTLSGGQELRILEVGAGTGSTTQSLLKLLAHLHVPVLYTFSDISPSLVASAKKKFAEYNSLRFETLDIECEPDARLADTQDIVLSTNCLHATKSLDETLTNALRLLKPGGTLLLLELVRTMPWFDLVFGLLDGWWRFEDDRNYTLADSSHWKRCILKAGFESVQCSGGKSQESEYFKLFWAMRPHARNFVQEISMAPQELPDPRNETVPFAEIEGQILYADIYYPHVEDVNQKPRPVALMIHGGGHTMLSRKDVRSAQISLLLELGFIPISVDYRLCPETSLLRGAMMDVAKALSWTRSTLAALPLRRSDVAIDPSKVVVVGWSTGGQLAMSMGWTAAAYGVKPPDASLIFYAPTDYHDTFWSTPNFPGELSALAISPAELKEGNFGQPLTAYHVPKGIYAPGGWMTCQDPRGRLLLYMNWEAATVQVLLGALSSDSKPLSASRRHHYHIDEEQTNTSASSKSLDSHLKMMEKIKKKPRAEDVDTISPLAQIYAGAYTVPTYLIHGENDDLIPWKQAERTGQVLKQKGIKAVVDILPQEEHLFDLRFENNANKTDARGVSMFRVAEDKAGMAVVDGYKFLARQVGLMD